MPRKTVYEARIDYLQVLDENGKLDTKLAKDTLTDEQVLHLYEHMVTCRHYDEIAFKLQRSGRMGTYPQNKGQEAAAIGAGHALKKGTDWLVPCYRENAALFMHGLPMHYILLHWMGDERGNQIPDDVNVTPISIPIGTHMLHAAGIGWAFKLRGEERGNQIPDDVNVTPISIPIGTHMLHAAGIGWAFKLRGEERVVMTFFGDGATSEGDFHEAMNFAAVFEAPVVFLCQNNHWAISVPRETQTTSETFAQKAIAYGMPTIQVDGNDLFAVYKASKEAVDRARGGGGPSFIEAVTYRLGDHTTADDARRYRDAEELDAWQRRDPIIRTRKYLVSKGLWDDEKQQRMEQKAEKIVEEVKKAAEGIEAPTTDDIFDYTFASLPPEILKQRETLRTSSLGQHPEQAGLRAETEHV